MSHLNEDSNLFEMKKSVSYEDTKLYSNEENDFKQKAIEKPNSYRRSLLFSFAHMQFPPHLEDGCYLNPLHVLLRHEPELIRLL